MLSGQLLLLLQLCWFFPPTAEAVGGKNPFGMNLGKHPWEKKKINVRIRWRMLLLDIPHIRSLTWDCSYLSHHTYLSSFTTKICCKNHNNDFPTAQMPMFLIKWKFQNNEQESVISRMHCYTAGLQCLWKVTFDLWAHYHICFTHNILWGLWWLGLKIIFFLNVPGF